VSTNSPHSGKPFRYAWFALPMAVLLPAAVAWMLGSLIFRQTCSRRVLRDLTQALAVAFVTLLVGQQGLTGRHQRLTNVHELLGLNLRNSRTGKVLT